METMGALFTGVAGSLSDPPPQADKKKAHKLV